VPTRQSLILSPQSLLDTLLDDPRGVAQLQALSGAQLNKLVQAIGLEDAGAALSLATREQLIQVMDEDLWKSPAPGQAERLDERRFGLWLEVLADQGPEVLARKLKEMDRDLMLAGLSQHLLVVETRDLMRELRGEDEAESSLLEKRLESTYNHELGDYWLVTRDEASWNALLGALVSLDEEDHELLSELLDRLCALSNREVDDAGGLFELLSSSQQAMEDAAEGREQRRLRAGYVPPADAAAFLRLARAASVQAALAAPAEDAITRAYFRSLQGWGEPEPAPEAAAEPGAPALGHSLLALLALLEQAELAEAGEPLRLAAAPGKQAPDEAELMRQHLLGLKQGDPKAFAAATRELGFLANALASGLELHGQAPRPAEAAALALAFCGLGLGLAPAAAPALTLFKAGFTHFGITAGRGAMHPLLQACRPRGKAA
jgi:hypothetical protein